ncbi:MAG: phosphatase PAP2 family protein [Eubacteriales bacterium]|nr:phosphatase PAP2 family protein [Christensenellaceae bacterium]MEA5066599.1 phosphatase PAP2 family protein [Eubacteriales bacterium]
MSAAGKYILPGTLIGLMALGAAFDLPISRAFHAPDSLFARFFAAFGQFPSYALAAFSFFALAAVRRSGGRAFGAPDAAWVALGLFACALAPGLALIALNLPLRWAAPLGLVLALPLWRTARRWARGDAAALAKAALVISLTMIFQEAAVQLIKLLWGRPRYRTILADNAAFLPWFRPAGRALGEAFKSFPSAHSSDAAVTVCAMLLAPFVPALRGRQGIVPATCGLWTVCVMLSRIAAGAHFLSDVAAGALIALLAYRVARRLADRPGFMGRCGS